MVDESSSYNWIYLLQRKSKIEDIFLPFRVMIEKQMGQHIKAIQFDNAKEFLALGKWFSHQGVVHCPYTHWQKGKVEHHSRHIIDTMLILLQHGNYPLPIVTMLHSVCGFFTIIIHHMCCRGSHLLKSSPVDS